MQNTEQLQNIEVSIEEAKTAIQLKDNLLRLSSNDDFISIIEHGYFKSEAARLVMAKSAGLTVEQQTNIDNMIFGVGALYNYLNSVHSRGMQMEAALRDDESAREEILQEELV